MHEVSYLRKVVYEIHEFPELLALKGHDITFFEFDEGATRQSIKEPRDRVIQGRIHKDAKLRLVTPHRFGFASLDRIWAIFSSIPSLVRLFAMSKFDVVLNFAVPTYAIQLNLIAKFFGVPVMHRALDVSSRIRESLWNPLIYLYEYFAFALPEKLSANNPAMANYLKTRTSANRHKDIEIHYPPLDTRIFRPVKRDSKLAASLGLNKKDKVLVYMGSFFYFSGLDEVISSLASTFNQDENLKLLLIGGGEQEQELRELVAKLKLNSQVVFSGFVAFQELSRYMVLGDVAINPLKDSLVAGAAFPHKVLQYMATGIPTVSTKLEGLYAAFGDSSGIAWADTPKDVSRIALELLNQPRVHKSEQVALQMRTVEVMFSTEATVDALEKSLENLSKRRNK